MPEVVPLPGRRIVVIEDRPYDAAVTRALVDAWPAGLDARADAIGLNRQELVEALSALERGGLARRDEMDWYFPTERLSRALMLVVLP